MERRTLIFLAVGVAILMVIVTVAGLRSGIPSATKRLVAAESAQLEATDARFRKQRAEIESAITGDPALFAASDLVATWKERLEAGATRLASARSALETARETLATNDREKRVEIETAALEARRLVRTVADETRELAERVEERVRLKREFTSTVAGLAATRESARAVSLDPLRDRVRAAAAEWPEKRADLEARLARLAALPAAVETSWSEALAAGARPDAAPEDIDYEAVLRAAKALRASSDQLVAGQSQLGSLIDQLHVSWDKILADMEIVEGATVTFRHKIKTITTQVALGDAASAAASENAAANPALAPVEDERWVSVDRSRYLAMEQNLGMVTEHKDAGKYESEATKITQAPGYAYVAPPGQRNRYGYWENRGGSSYWAFYGQYAFLRNMFWGNTWGNGVSSSHYRHYHDSFRSGRTWYGDESGGRSVYGSKGTYAASRYADSKFRSTNGFESTQFKKSGGTYRGSRYQTTSRSGGGYSGSRYSTPSSRSSGFGSSSSRSYSSRSTSRSFGGGSRSGGGK